MDEDFEDVDPDVEAILYVEVDGEVYEQNYEILRSDWEDMTPEQREEELIDAMETFRQHIAPARSKVLNGDAQDLPG